MKVIAWLEFELNNLESVVKLFGHYTTGATPNAFIIPSFIRDFPIVN